MYTIYNLSKTEVYGIKPTDDYVKSNLVSFDFISDTEKIIYAFDNNPSFFQYNEDKSVIVYDQYPKIIYVDLKGDKQKKEIIKEYSNCSFRTFKGKKFA